MGGDYRVGGELIDFANKLGHKRVDGSCNGQNIEMEAVSVSAAPPLLYYWQQGLSAKA